MDELKVQRQAERRQLRDTARLRHFRSTVRAFIAIQAACLVAVVLRQQWGFWLSFAISAVFVVGTFVLRKRLMREWRVEREGPDLPPWLQQSEHSNPMRPPTAEEESRSRNSSPPRVRLKKRKTASQEVAMRYAVTGITLLCAVFVILSNKYDAGTRDWAYGAVGAVIGYWLR
jgi:small-conductance mechanosensitive channel